MEMLEFINAKSNRINYEMLGDMKNALNNAPSKIVIGEKEFNLHIDEDPLNRVNEVLEDFKNTLLEELKKLDDELKEI